jgi:hypothetical protein
MNANLAPTSFYGNLMVLNQGLARLGINIGEIYAEAGIDIEQYVNRDQRIPWQLNDRVWELAVARTGNPCLGLDVIEDLNPAIYQSLGIALICSSSLRDFLQ